MNAPSDPPQLHRNLVEAYRSDRRPDRPETDTARPWVMLNMIASIDGAIAVDGVSGGLGGPADLAVFKTLRSQCDAVLVAAGTVRAERYKPPAMDPAVQAERRSRGQRDLPLIAVVTRSLDLDLETALFTTPGYRPVVITVSDAPDDRRAATEEVATVIEAGRSDVDMTAAVTELAAITGQVILAEGGPTLNAQLVEADVLDELCVTVSPNLVGGAGGRMLAGGSDHETRRYVLDRALAADDLLFCRWLRRR